MHNEKEGMPVTALREIKILKALKHPAVVELLDMFIVGSAYLYSTTIYIFTDVIGKVTGRSLRCRATWSFRTWTTIWLDYLRTSA